MTGQLLIFGEVLYDYFPDGRRVLGGAPFNVAWHLQAFGQMPLLVSRVGRDAEGDDVRSAMRAWGMEDAGLGRNSQRPTGRVVVSFHEGEPNYEIQPHCAFDAIETPVPAKCEVLYHGSLATREQQSRQALWELRRKNPKLIFFDVNLRHPWWRHDEIEELLAGTHWVKLNQEELVLLQPGVSKGREAMEGFLEQHRLEGLILTRGAEGAELLTRAGDYRIVAPEPATQLVDTVGAGDAFTAVAILGLLREWPLQQLLERAQQFATRVVGLRGAITEDRLFYAPLLQQWQVNP